MYDVEFSQQILLTSSKTDLKSNYIVVLTIDCQK